MRVGIEVGGTFTDLIALDGDEVRVPRSRACRAAPRKACSRLSRRRIFRCRGSPTSCTGRRWRPTQCSSARAASPHSSTTAGFRDLLLIQRQDRPKIYTLSYQKPAAVVERRDVIEIEERMLADGSVATALDPAAAAATLAAALSARPYKAVAICLLNAYANPAHERALADLIRARFPDLYVSCSSRDQPRVPRVRARIDHGAVRVRAADHRQLPRPLRGRASRAKASPAASRSCNRTAVACLPARSAATRSARSSPARPRASSGAIRQIGASGYRNLVTFDMGGTSTDVCLVSDGKPIIAPETAVDGLPIRTPVVDIASVGAGGGSIVWRDAGGMLRVGPRSSGADPGPGVLRPRRHGADHHRRARHPRHHPARSRSSAAACGSTPTARARASSRRSPTEFDMTVEQIADSAIRLADANVVRAIQLISTELGRDPRDYVLVPFGGAGPAARGAHRRGSRHRDHRRAAERGRALGVRPARVRLHAIRHGDAQGPARRGGARRRAGRSSPRCAAISMRACARRGMSGALDVCVHAADALRRPGVRGRGAVDARRARRR